VLTTANWSPPVAVASAASARSSREDEATLINPYFVAPAAENLSFASATTAYEAVEKSAQDARSIGRVPA